jgi:hypothetical protein
MSCNVLLSTEASGTYNYNLQQRRRPDSLRNDPDPAQVYSHLLIQASNIDGGVLVPLRDGSRRHFLRQNELVKKITQKASCGFQSEPSENIRKHA